MVLRQTLGAVAAAGLVVLAAGCDPGGQPGPAAASSPGSTAAGPAGATTTPPPPPNTRSPLAGDCPVTLPQSAGPPGVSPADFFGQGQSYGNGRLWVGGLPDGGVLQGDQWVEDDGWVGWKLGWWRVAPGKLRITGRRLDGAAAPVRADVPDGYGDRGFQSTGVHFATGGCWHLTGTVGGSPLTFVLRVLRRAG